MLIFKIDSDGFFIEDFISQGDDIDTPENFVSVKPPQGLFKPRWTGTEWIEGKTEEEFLEEEFLASLQPSQEEVKKAERELEIIELLIELEVI